MDDKPIAYGQFTSVWHKTASGDWKALIDFGCSHAKPDQAVATLQAPDYFSTKTTVAQDTSASNRALMQTERDFAQTARTRSLSDAYQRVLPTSDSIRLLREGNTIYEGLAAKKLASSSGQQIDYQPVQVITAASGDFGYSYGYATFNQSRQGYVRIWRQRGGHWQLAHEVVGVTLN